MEQNTTLSRKRIFLLLIFFSIVITLIVLGFSFGSISGENKTENSDDDTDFFCSGALCYRCLALPGDYSEQKILDELNAVGNYVCFRLWLNSMENFTIKSNPICCPKEILPNETFSSFYKKQGTDFIIGFRRYE